MGRAEKNRVSKDRNLTAIRDLHASKPATAVNDFREKIRGDVQNFDANKVEIRDEQQEVPVNKERKLTDFDSKTKQSVDKKT